MDSRARVAYGLSCLADFDWLWCPQHSSDAVDLRISLGSLGRFEAYPDRDYTVRCIRASSDPFKPPIVVLKHARDGHWRLIYAAGAEFVIDSTASEILGISVGELTRDDLLVYLQGPVLGFVQRLRGVTCLHASAAVVGGCGVAIVGRGGMGKSSSAATFARLGNPILTDDVLALRDGPDGFYVQPGLPRVLLWPESVGALFGDDDALPRIVSTWDKRYLDLTQPGYHFAKEAAPLAAIYLLGDRLKAGEEAVVAPLHGTGALMRLVANTYANDFLDASMRAEELKVLARVVAQVPIRQVRAPSDRAALPRICEAIIADALSLQAG